MCAHTQWIQYLCVWILLQQGGIHPQQVGRCTCTRHLYLHFKVSIHSRRVCRYIDSITMFIHIHRKYFERHLSRYCTHQTNQHKTHCKTLNVYSASSPQLRQREQSDSILHRDMHYLLYIMMVIMMISFSAVLKTLNVLFL